MTMRRAYTAGKFALEVDGTKAGWLYGYEGGMASCDVVTEKVGPDHMIHKHISGIKYDDITVSCGPSMSEHFYQWINTSFQRDYGRRDGCLVGADFDMKETSRLDFHQALVTEVTFPACDAASKDTAKLQVKFSPEWTRPGTPARSIAGGYAIDPRVGKRWLNRNFRVRIDGLNAARVSKLEAITIKQKVSEVPLGESREVFREPTSIEYPHVVLTIPEVDAASWMAWYKSFVLDGRCSPQDEKQGQIEFLADDVRTVICHIDLDGLGIFKVTPDRAESGSEKIREVKIEMYCETMKFNITGAYA